MENLERYLQVLDNFYDEKGDARIILLKTKIKAYINLVERNNELNIEEHIHEIGKLVAKVIDGFSIKEAIQIVESKISDIEKRYKSSTFIPKIGIQVLNIDMVSEDRAIVHVKISNEGKKPIEARALKVLDDKGVLTEIIQFKEKILNPYSTIEKYFSLKIGKYRLKFIFALEEYGEIERESLLEIEPIVLPWLSIELISPPDHACLAPPLTFQVKITFNGKPIEKADVVFYIENEETKEKETIGFIKTNSSGYAEIKNWDPDWKYEVTLNWWAEASKAGYKKNISERRMLIFFPLKIIIERAINEIKNFLWKIESE
jgi:hypothetical protein